ncbi:MAG: c-di-GMP-binding flagellar brake protein YcgR [Phenylobacterium sp.]|jgi:c-di-GMP-binding flagellar brake protein YcgR
MLNHDDKRSFFRMMVNADLELTLDDSEAGRVIDAICRDVSSTGMSAEVQEPIEAGARLKAKLASSNPSVPALSADARVIRCSQEFDDTYVLGLEFIELN